MSEGRPNTTWNWRWLWPKIYDIGSARAATQYGVGAAAFISVATAGVATISLVAQKPILGFDAWVYIDALLMAIVAWRIRGFSRVFAVGGIAFFFIEKFVLMPSSQGAAMAFILSILLINGARGVFAYNRFKPTSVWGEFPHAREHNQPNGTAATAATTIRDSATDNNFFEQALTEVESGQLIKAIWARSLAGAEGEEAKTKALYIRYRAENLKSLAVDTSKQPDEDQQTAENGNAKVDAQQMSALNQSGGTLSGRILMGAIMSIFLAVAVIALVHKYKSGAVSTQRWQDMPIVQPSISETLPPQVFEIVDSTSYERGWQYLREQDYAQAAKWFEKSAESGFLPAQQALVLIYGDGVQGVNQDSKRAAYWLEKVETAAKEGNAIAQHYLVSIYAEGRYGSNQDSKRAAYWLEKIETAARMGNATAQYWLGDMFLQGTGVAQDYVQSRYWYEQAAAKGDEGAQCILGYHFYLPGRFPGGLVEAHKWFNICATNTGINSERRGPAIEGRDRAASKMTGEQIAEAQRRATEWMKAHK